MTELTAVSLFAGVGGFELALGNYGVKVVASVEIDDAARGVLAHKFPDSKLFLDVKEVTGDDLIAAGFIPERGIITGGFPDDWTEQRYDYKKGKVVEQADSSRYKQMGNAVAVPVVDWIIGRLVEADANDRQA